LNGNGPPEKEGAPACDRGAKVRRDPPKVATADLKAQGLKPQPGQYRGFSQLKSQPGVYRCKLFHQAEKRDPGHADYKGVLPLTGSKALIFIWVHADGSLGLRLEKIQDRRKNGATN
jgi:hypothetical protein